MLTKKFASNLNTSHVKVKRSLQKAETQVEEYLNTSHVKVKHAILYNIRQFIKFKYISC